MAISTNQIKWNSICPLVAQFESLEDEPQGPEYGVDPPTELSPVERTAH